MVREKFDYLDLDVLDSPLMSSTPFTFLNGVPGSAIAENIFNDPHSWEDDGDVEDRALDPLAWLAEGIEKFKTNSADVYGAFDLAITDKRKSGLFPPAADGRMELGSGLKGIKRASKIRPISIPYLFEPAHDENIQDQLSKILDASGIPHHIRPLSSSLSPPSAHYPSKINTPTVAGSTVDGPSPVVAHSSSITMSFLEWYGIYPEAELNLRSLRQQPRTSINSFIPPPGLEPPQSPALASSQPPPYTRSPAGSRPNSGSRSRSSSNLCSQSPTHISVQRLSNRDSNVSNGPRRRRRLPSIPPEASPLPPLRSSPVLPSTERELPALAPQLQEPTTSSLRPLSSVRSPLVGPAGPRTRANSRRRSEESITRGACLRPPVLKL